MIKEATKNMKDQPESFEVRLFNEIHDLRQEVQTLRALVVVKEKKWVSKMDFMMLTKLRSSTINNKVSKGEIVKKGRLYLYDSAFGRI